MVSQFSVGGYLGTKGVPVLLKSLRLQLHLHKLNLSSKLSAWKNWWKLASCIQLDNNLQDAGAKVVFEYLKDCKTLTWLSLSGIKLLETIFKIDMYQTTSSWWTRIGCSKASVHQILNTWHWIVSECYLNCIGSHTSCSEQYQWRRSVHRQSLSYEHNIGGAVRWL